MQFHLLYVGGRGLGTIDQLRIDPLSQCVCMKTNLLAIQVLCVQSLWELIIVGFLSFTTTLVNLPIG